MKRNLWILAIVGAVLLSAAPVLADGDFYVVMGGGGVGTRISSLPFTINFPGFYYVSGNLNCNSGNGITVNEHDVTIDLMGFRLSGNSSGSGIFMNGRHNVEIRNGTLRDWSCAIFDNAGAGTYNDRIINIRAENNVNGILLSGACHVIKGCTFTDHTDSCINIGGSIVTDNVISHANIGITNSGITKNNIIYSCSSKGIISSGTVSGNYVTYCGIGIDADGPIIGNKVFADTNQTGIKYVGESVLDQNSVSGNGTHYSGSSSLTVWAGKNADNLWGSNAGHP
jgi:large repetitive protein